MMKYRPVMFIIRVRLHPSAKGYRNFDVLKSMIKEAHKKSIKVYAWVPQFHDRAALKKYPMHR